MRAVAYELPPDGVDLRAELAEHQRALVEQALDRAGGNHARAAHLLGLRPLELYRLAGGRLELVDGMAPAPAKGAPPKLEISRTSIRAMAADGWTPREIAVALSINQFAVEKILRAEAEQLAKCGPLPRGEQRA